MMDNNKPFRIEKVYEMRSLDGSKPEGIPDEMLEAVSALVETIMKAPLGIHISVNRAIAVAETLIDEFWFFPKSNKQYKYAIETMMTGLNEKAQSERCQCDSSHDPCSDTQCDCMCD